MKAPVALCETATKSCSLQSTYSALDFCASGYFRLEIHYTVTFEVDNWCPEIGAKNSNIFQSMLNMFTGAKLMDHNIGQPKGTLKESIRLQT